MADQAVVSRRRRRVRRIGLWLAIALVVYTLVGFAGVPLIARHVVLARINDAMVGTINVTAIRFNPFKWTLRLEDVKVSDQSGKVVASLVGFAGGLRPFDTLFSSGWHFQRASVREPFVRGEIYKGGETTLARVLKPMPAPTGGPTKPRRIPRIVIERLSVENGRIAFRDETPPEPFEAEWQDLNFDLEQVDTRPANENLHRLEMKTAEGERIAWEGTFFVDPISSKGRVSIERLGLARFMPYAMGVTDARVTGGRLSASAEYDFAPARQPRRALVRVASANVEELTAEAEGRPLARVARVELKDAVLNADGRSLDVGAVLVRGAQASVRRERDGGLEVARMIRLGSPSDTTPSAASEVQVPPTPLATDKEQFHTIESLIAAIQSVVRGLSGTWATRIERVEVEESAVTFTDAATRRPVSVAVTGVGLQAGPISSGEGFATAFSLASKVGDTGTLSVRGQVWPMEPRVQLEVDGAGLSVETFGPYLPREFAAEVKPAELVGGVLSLAGTLTGSRGADGALSAEWKGRTALANARAAADGGQDDVVKVQELGLDGGVKARASATALEAAAWSGKATIKGLQFASPLRQAVQIDPAIPAAELASATIDLDGSSSVSLEGEGTLNATWDGVATISGVRVVAAGATEPLVALGRAELRSRAELGAGAAPKLMVADGQLLVSELSASVPAIPGVSGTSSAALKAASVNASGLAVDLGQKQVAVGDVTIERPVLDGVLRLLPPPTEPGAAKARADDATGGRREVRAIVPALPMGVRVDALRVRDGAITLSDPEAQPPVSAAVDEVSLDVLNFVSVPGTPAEITLSARVQASGRANIQGKVDLFQTPPVADVAVRVEALPLKPYDPIAGRYAGYLVDEGRMSLNLPVKASEGRVQGTIGFNFDRLRLGQSVPSPDAPDIPLKFGLDLLRDGKDQITGTIPFSGDLSDPKFSVGGIIWRAFLGLIGNVVTAPFKALGAVFGASEGQDLSQAEFAPGTADLSSAGRSAIDVLAKALKDRPAIALIVAPKFDRKADGDVLARAALRRLMREQAGIRRPELTAEEYQRAIERAYRDKLRAAGQRPPSREQQPTLEQMEAALLVDVKVGEEELVALAKRRGEIVLEVFAKDHGLPAGRVTLQEPGADSAAEKPIVAFDLPKK